MKKDGGSVQTGNVISQGLDFTIVQFSSNLTHLQVVFANPISELGQLRSGVVGVLATQARVLRGDACTVGAVATGTCRDLSVSDTTPVNLFAQRREFFVFGKTGFGFVAAQIGTHIAHVVFTQGRGKTHHDRIGAFAGFELSQLLGQVFGVLLRKFGVGGNGGIAVCTVAADANTVVNR